MYSLTKSILSALIGIAIGEGHIQNVKQPIADYFPALATAADPRKRSILVEHLLTMTPGLDWPDFDKPYWKMKRTPDWVSFILNQPMAHTPGEAFTYNSGGSHLLSAILAKTTGESVYDYAKRHLFDKLGFTRPRWNSSAGIHEGGAGLHLRAQDMATFGQLFLQKGNWNGQQLVPAEWVANSTSIHNPGLHQYEPPIFGEYGYHWWVTPEDGTIPGHYFAKGYGGQYLFVMPELALVAAIRKEPEGKSRAICSKQLFYEWIIPLARERRR
ncbi:hypothetical protein GCM10010911_21280 [Paenibacillus nasutitermitis]|uniref:Beta-lactamase-related domain-containing protein n=1 Tax=Paenibacillus nasutitermitis TaxID=1652958 RepID=A0A916YVV3_9BACL|nr:hypothetical protein GCM10010911_21280 [Paenibacillus nasutitermitis]